MDTPTTVIAAGRGLQVNAIYRITNLMLLHRFVAALNSDTSGLLPSWLCRRYAVARTGSSRESLSPSKPLGTATG